MQNALLQQVFCFRLYVVKWNGVVHKIIKCTLQNTFSVNTLPFTKKLCLAKSASGLSE